MTAAAPAHGERTAAAAALALGVTLAIQVFTSLAGTTVSVLATEIAADLVLPAKLVGAFVGLIYASGMVASLLCGAFIEHHGPLRISQVCSLVCAVGVGLVVAAAAWPAFAIATCAVAALVIGIGYGPITPASSQILAATTPVRRMALVLSIKQTGVPAGAALAGAMLPAMALAWGWRTTLGVVAALGCAVALASQPMRARLDRERRPAQPFSVGRFFAPLATVFRARDLAVLVVASFIYSAVQVCLISFLVVYLAETLGFALTLAGYALTAANLGGIVGRIGWGALADHLAQPRRLFGVLGLLSASMALATAAFAPTWPVAALFVVCTCFGATAIGWNGVYLGEIARHSPPGQAGAVTGACGFVTFAGVVTGPPLFALLTTISGSYRPGFVACAVCAGAIGTYLVATSRKPPAREPRPADRK